MRQHNHQSSLKCIKGIGIITERQLHKAGIDSIEILAKQSSRHLKELIPQSTVTQSELQEWIHQAQRLSSQHKNISINHASLAVSNRQRYATFTLEILIDKSDRVRRTRVVHIQSGEENHWAAWDESRLLNCIARQAHAKLAITPKTKAELPDVKTLAKPVDAVPSPCTTKTKKNPNADPQLFSISVTKIKLTPQTIQMHALVEFELSGSQTTGVTDHQERFIIEILACDLITAQITVMTSYEDMFQANQLVYNVSLNFPSPKVGRYQLEIIVFLPEKGVGTIELGPILTVIP